MPNWMSGEGMFAECIAMKLTEETRLGKIIGTAQRSGAWRLRTAEWREPGRPSAELARNWSIVTSKEHKKIP
jgi:hypothetical protein